VANSGRNGDILMMTLQSRPAIPAEMLDRYLANACSTDERAEVEGWLDADADRRSLVVLLRGTLARGSQRQVDPPAAWSAFLDRTRQGANGRRIWKDGRAERIDRPFSTYILPTMAVVAACGFMIALGKLSSNSTVVPPRTYTTSAGQRATLELPHGARAELGPATTLTVAVGSPGGATVVTIAGEAHFTVAAQRRIPFTVHTKNAIAHVLGTRFIVRRYDSDRDTRVLVTEGRVSVGGAREAAGIHPRRVLESNMLGVVNDSGGVAVTSNVALDDVSGWTSGRLVFRKTPVREAVIELSRVYGVDLRVTDSALAAQTLNWTISLENRSIDDVLVPLSAVLDAHTVRSGKVITLVPGQSAMQKPVNSRSLSSQETSYGK
jgi:transmembrane sensor